MANNVQTIEFRVKHQLVDCVMTDYGSFDVVVINSSDRMGEMRRRSGVA